MVQEFQLTAKKHPSFDAIDEVDRDNLTAFHFFNSFVLSVRSSSLLLSNIQCLAQSSSFPSVGFLLTFDFSL